MSCHSYLKLLSVAEQVYGGVLSGEPLPLPVPAGGEQVVRHGGPAARLAEALAQTLATAALQPRLHLGGQLLGGAGVTPWALLTLWLHCLLTNM